MNVLVINGSPKGKHSNTMKLTQAFLKGTGYGSTDIVNVANTKIKPCLGCFACWNKTPGTCAIDDEMGEVLSKLIAADIVIWAFPLYYFSVPGALKNIIDRQLPLALPFMVANNDSGGHPPRYDLSSQRHVLISTCGFWIAQDNYDAVIAMFDHYYGAENYTKILCGQGELFRIPELKSQTSAYLRVIERAGAEFAAGSISTQTRVELETPLFSRDVFEKMADASWGIKQDNQKPSDESLSFTTQMAALYRPDGKNRVLEFYYTDIDKTYQILLTPQGSQVITEDFKKYTTRIETPLSIWRSIGSGKISGQEALFQRQYKVLGDFETMLHWDELFGTAAPNKLGSEKKKRKANMLVLLAPWIVIWTAIAINAKLGGIMGISLAAALPLLWLVFQPVVFEQISVPVVTGLSLAVLLGTDAHIIMPVSYAVFGIMWLVSVFMSTPLTAYYSAANYGDEKAMENPLFVHTNRILTAIWGVLFLITAVWTYFLMRTDISVYTGLINSVCPVLMGVFTAWFQKWYPAHWAKG